MTNEELHNRIRSALIMLADGHAFRVGELFFSCKDNLHFSVSGETHNNLLENVTQQSALVELNDIKTLFTSMVNSSKELSEFIKDRHIEYLLGYDYGMGSILICSEINGQVIWKQTLKK